MTTSDPAPPGAIVKDEETGASDPSSLQASSSPAKATENQNPNPAVAKKIADYQSKNARLEQQIQETMAKQRDVDSQLKTKDPQKLTNDHIRLLHRYNEIRDVGQGLMGIIADQRGVRAADVYRDFGVSEGD